MCVCLKVEEQGGADDGGTERSKRKETGQIRRKEEERPLDAQEGKQKRKTNKKNAGRETREKVELE